MPVHQMKPMMMFQPVVESQLTPQAHSTLKETYHVMDIVGADIRRSLLSDIKRKSVSVNE